MPLRSPADDLWVADDPAHRYLGLSLGTRMTVVRLPGGDLLLHSPVRLDADLTAAIRALGEVTHVVAPSLYHHVFAGDAVAAFEGALLHAPAALAKKRRDLTLDAHLSDTPHPDWGGALVPVPIEGCMLQETVLVHPASGTIISSDLTENFASSDHLPTRLYLKAAGLEHQVGWSRLLRMVYRDHRAARASLDRLREHGADRLIIAHGAILESGAREAIDQTFHFLKA